MIFNTFVFMQIFNEINARKIKANEYNVFDGFFNNFLFLFVEVLTIVVQVALMQYGGSAVKTSYLTLDQHLWCAGIGALSLIVGYVVKFLPRRLFSI